MTSGMNTIVVPVKDLAHAKELYGALLGVAPYADQPYYAGFRLGDLELGLNPGGHASGMTGPVCYWEVADIKAAVQALTDAGGTVQQDPTNVGGGKLIATVRDADGNPVGLMQTP